jgi:hypothetical protein
MLQFAQIHTPGLLCSAVSGQSSAEPMHGRFFVIGPSQNPDTH